ncbi:ZGRF1 protein, partial [Serilophus lunatus]|nr:ZGRF1 protein [Serilophus lunatus]
VLYTHQKTKKSKTWQDGILRIRTGRNQATLFDDKGQCLESIFMKSQVAAGDNLESERYLITVEAAKASEKPLGDQPRKAETPAGDRNGGKPGLLPPRHLPVGLKRKFTGFQGPRQVEKKIPAVEAEGEAALLPLSRQGQGTFPSTFYTSSPLFSTVYTKEAGMNPFPGFQGSEACRDSDREHVSVSSSLLSAPSADRWEGTEEQSSAQFVVEAGPPLLAGQTGPRAVSHSIRSTAQIIALLKSKPARGHGEQTPAATDCLSRVQAAGNVGLYDKNSTAPPALSGGPAKGLVPNIQYLPFAKGIVNDKDWDAEMPRNSAEQPCDEEATGERRDKKVNNLSQDFQDLCNTKTCLLPEPTPSRMSDSQLVPSSGDISPSASPTTFVNNPFGYREHSGTEDLRENSSVKMQGELQPRQNSGGVPSGPELSRDVTLSAAGVVEEESKGEDVAQNAAQRPHSCCEGERHSRNELSCSTFDRESEGNDCTGGILSELCENSVRNVRRTASQPRTEGEFSGEIYGSPLSIEGTSSKEDLDGSAAPTISGTSLIGKQHPALLPGDANVKECHSGTSMFEATERTSGVSPLRVVSAMDKSARGVAHLGCRESPDVGSGHLWGMRSDDIKPGSPLLPLSQKSDLGGGSFQHTAEGPKIFGISHMEDTLISRSSMHPLGTGHSSPEETATGGNEFENAESTNASPEACRGERVGVDCLECTAVAEDSSGLPALVNDIALVRALTQHSTALESLQKMEENSSTFCE